MNSASKNKFPWDTMDTTVIMTPEEIVAYHLYRLRLEQKNKREKGIKDNRNVLRFYLQKEYREKEEDSRCFQK